MRIDQLAVAALFRARGVVAELDVAQVDQRPQRGPDSGATRKPVVEASGQPRAQRCACGAGGGLVTECGIQVVLPSARARSGEAAEDGAPESFVPLAGREGFLEGDGGGELEEALEGVFQHRQRAPRVDGRIIAQLLQDPSRARHRRRQAADPIWERRGEHGQDPTFGNEAYQGGRRERKRPRAGGIRSGGRPRQEELVPVVALRAAEVHAPQDAPQPTTSGLDGVRLPAGGREAAPAGGDGRFPVSWPGRT